QYNLAYLPQVVYNSSDVLQSIAVEVINGEYNLDIIVLNANGKIRVFLNADNGALLKQALFPAGNDP
ncbi:unnamed protein product, partial [Adineta ricciae]